MCHAAVAGTAPTDPRPHDTYDTYEGERRPGHPDARPGHYDHCSSVAHAHGPRFSAGATRPVAQEGVSDTLLRTDPGLVKKSLDLRTV
ncbi:hypothetical protein [Streptomyces beigongshangae]|uniref:hypothetical protein n=1 Tax=Streptomyces beigongshangae TaxID=2841597 RepID=UPI001C846F0F|nr:hypothetical protein [Streptomyces sp. REN17]